MLLIMISIYFMFNGEIYELARDLEGFKLLVLGID